MKVRMQDHLGKQRLRKSWPVYSLELEWIRANEIFEFKQRREAMVTSVTRVTESRKSSKNYSVLQGRQYRGSEYDTRHFCKYVKKT